MRAEECAGEIRLHDSIPLIKRQILKGYGERRRAGVIEEHIEPPAVLQEAQEKVRNRTRISDIGAHDETLPACEARGLGKGLRAPASQDDTIARGRKRHGNRAADA